MSRIKSAHFLLHLFSVIQVSVSFVSTRLFPSKWSRPYSSPLASTVIIIENEGACFEKTGITRELQWDSVSKPIPIRKEIELLESGVLVQRGEFCKVHGDRLQEVKEECQYLGMTLPQGLLIRRQLMVSKIIQSGWKLKNQKNLVYIVGRFQNQGCALLELSQEMDLPPVSLLRAMVAERVYEAYPKMFERDRKRIVKSIISEKAPENVGKFLTDYEISELQIAKQYDVVGYSEETATPVLWEEALYTYLDEQEINYVSEEKLRDADMKITPDCLILDDCYINGQLIRWMDVKSFYGSGLRENTHFTNSLKKQLGKYESAFNEGGAVVFKHGFSSKLRDKNPSALFLDAGPLVDNMEFNGEENL